MQRISVTPRQTLSDRHSSVMIGSERAHVQGRISLMCVCVCVRRGFDEFPHTTHHPLTKPCVDHRAIIPPMLPRLITSMNIHVKEVNFYEHFNTFSVSLCLFSMQPAPLSIYRLLYRWRDAQTHKSISVNVTYGFSNCTHTHTHTKESVSAAG